MMHVVEQTMASVELKGSAGVRWRRPSCRRCQLVIEDGNLLFGWPLWLRKSTTLRMVAGLEDITEGDLSIDGQRVNEVASRDRDIAWCSITLYPVPVFVRIIRSDLSVVGGLDWS